jgi:hypothetical protein
MGIRQKGHFGLITSSVFNRPELVTNNPELVKLSIFPLDEAWGRELLNDPQARASILRLTAAQPGFEFRTLLFQPEAINFQLNQIHLNNITPENLRAWIYDLLDLIRIAETLFPPSVTTSVSSMERKARLNRSDLTLPILGITCGLFVFFMSIFIVIAFAFIYMNRGGF